VHPLDQRTHGLGEIAVAEARGPLVPLVRDRHLVEQLVGAGRSRLLRGPVQRIDRRDLLGEGAGILRRELPGVELGAREDAGQTSAAEDRDLHRVRVRAPYPHRCYKTPTSCQALRTAACSAPENASPATWTVASATALKSDVGPSLSVSVVYQMRPACSHAFPPIALAAM